MQEISLALVGFGNVAQGLTHIIAEQNKLFAQRYDLNFKIVAIADPLRGTYFNPEGAPLAELLLAAGKPNGLQSVSGEHPGWDALEMIVSAPANVVIELSYTNLTTGEPATSYLKEALQRGKHVVTTNKGPIALHYTELAEMARIRDLQIGVEGTVMSGTPCLRVGRNLLAGAGIRRIEGILNGTTNFILTQMENGQPYAQALAEAQAQGYAEADPTGDVEGFDAAAKVAILAQQVLGVPLPLAEVEREGISKLTPDDIHRAQVDGRRWKLVGSLEWIGDHLKGRVCPEMLPANHPLAAVGGVTNAIRFSTDLLGDVMLTGPGAGRWQTGYAVVQDLLAIYRRDCA